MNGAAIGGATAAAAAVGFAVFQGQYPTAQRYGATIHRERAAGRRIALTFDDGPNPSQTPRLLELLARRDAKATFFLIGRWAEREPALIREIVAAGHAIGNHTYTHPTMDQRIGRREVLGALAVTAGIAAFMIVSNPEGGRDDASIGGWLVAGGIVGGAGGVVASLLGLVVVVVGLAVLASGGSQARGVGFARPAPARPG